MRLDPHKNDPAATPVFKTNQSIDYLVSLRHMGLIRNGVGQRLTVYAGETEGPVITD
jgi:hypothetical protein